MEYILYSRPVKLRTMEIMVPPMSLYHMRKMLELKDSGTDFNNPTAEGLGKIYSLIVDIIKENHPDLTEEKFERECDTASLNEIMAAVQNLPKNLTAQTGTMTETQSLGQTETKIES